MNSFARRALPVEDKQPFEKMVLSFHPERSQTKVKFLLDQAECPVSNPPPMTMIINIPERVLLIKVTKMSDMRGDTFGYTLVFYDITDAVIREEPGAHAANTKRQLLKIRRSRPTGSCWSTPRGCDTSARKATTRGCTPRRARASATSRSGISRGGWTAIRSCAFTAATSPTWTLPSRSCAMTAR